MGGVGKLQPTDFGPPHIRIRIRIRPTTMLHLARECLQELGIKKIQHIKSSHVCQYTVHYDNAAHQGK